MLTAKEANKIIPVKNNKTLIDRISDVIQQRAENNHNRVNLCDHFRHFTFFDFEKERLQYGTELSSTGSEIYNTLIKNGYEVEISQFEDESPDFIVSW